MMRRLGEELKKFKTRLRSHSRSRLRNGSECSSTTQLDTIQRQNQSSTSTLNTTQATDGSSRSTGSRGADSECSSTTQADTIQQQISLPVPSSARNATDRSNRLWNEALKRLSQRIRKHYLRAPSLHPSWNFSRVCLISRRRSNTNGTIRDGSSL